MGRTVSPGISGRPLSILMLLFSTQSDNLLPLCFSVCTSRVQSQNKCEGGMLYRPLPNNSQCLCKWELPSSFPVKCSCHISDSKSTPTLRACMFLCPLGRLTTNSSSLQQVEERTWGILSIKSSEWVLVGFGCEVERFSARGFWVRLSPEISRFLIQISFRFRK